MSEKINEFNEDFAELQHMIKECNHLMNEIKHHKINESAFEQTTANIEKKLEFIREHLKHGVETEAERKKRALENHEVATEIVNEILNHIHFEDALHFSAHHYEEEAESYVHHLQERAKHLLDKLEEEKKYLEEQDKHFYIHPGAHPKSPFGEPDD